jgi:archaellum biogenesis ATPase FlaH
MRFGINYKARLIDITSYGIGSYDSLYGFVCGIYAANYDTTLIFIDSLYKITEDQDIHAVEEFLQKLQSFSESNGVDITIMISADVETATESVRKYF